MKWEIAIAQFGPEKGEPEANLAAIEDVLARVVELEPRPSLVVFPETALTGYFLEGGVREQARPAEWLFEELRARYRRVGDPSRPLDVAIGFYELANRRVYNSSLYADLGGAEPRILHVHRKVFLPTYGVFQEDRFVEAGAGVRAFDTAGVRCAMLVCEEAFHSISGTLAALDGAELILVHSASPARGAHPGPGLPGNLARWDLLASGIAAEHGVYVVVSQLTGFEGGKGFAGGSTVWTPRGERLARAPLWEEALLPVTLETEELLQARVEEPLLADLERAWTDLLLSSPGARVVGPTTAGLPAEASAQDEASAPAEASAQDEAAAPPGNGAGDDAS